jgi:hypothetical protein
MNQATVARIVIGELRIRCAAAWVRLQCLKIEERYLLWRLGR